MSLVLTQLVELEHLQLLVEPERPELEQVQEHLLELMLVPEQELEPECCSYRQHSHQKRLLRHKSCKSSRQHHMSCKSCTNFQQHHTSCSLELEHSMMVQVRSRLELEHSTKELVRSKQARSK